MQRKQDFLINNCETPNPKCNKPAPYNAFNWTTDSCSWTPTDWKRIFDSACQQHDFGYRNFWTGLALQPTELRRLKIDNVFYREMKRICQRWSNGPQKVTCYVTARAMYRVVRNASYWSGRY